MYPAVLAELWPDAEHQLCAFHIVKNINKLILDAVRRLRARTSAAALAELAARAPYGGVIWGVGNYHGFGARLIAYVTEAAPTGDSATGVTC